MKKILKSSVVWQFAGGFALGAAALFTLAPAEAEAITPAPVAVVSVR